VALTRAPGTCAEPGCPNVPVAMGRCREHLTWPKRNPARADDRTIRKLRDRLVHRDGYRCRHPEASERSCTRDDWPLEVHHLNGDPSDDRLDNLELHCRRHNPRGGAGGIGARDRRAASSCMRAAVMDEPGRPAAYQRRGRDPRGPCGLGRRI
jgi:hypothetical protein